MLASKLMGAMKRLHFKLAECQWKSCLDFQLKTRFGRTPTTRHRRVSDSGYSPHVNAHQPPTMHKCRKICMDAVCIEPFYRTPHSISLFPVRQIKTGGGILLGFASASSNINSLCPFFPLHLETLQLQDEMRLYNRQQICIRCG